MHVAYRFDLYLRFCMICLADFLLVVTVVGNIKT